MYVVVDGFADRPNPSNDALNKLFKTSASPEYMHSYVYPRTRVSSEVECSLEKQSFSGSISAQQLGFVMIYLRNST